MRPIRDTIPIGEALETLLALSAPIARTESVALDDAAGRVIAASVTAPFDVPPFDRAAMDGYAVVASDTFGAGRFEPCVLAVVEQVLTGATPTRAVAPGHCAEIATGAPMPEGADAVVMVEETERVSADAVRIFTPVYPRQHVGRRGADVSAGQEVLAGGELLTPARVGVLASLGVSAVDVFARPRVALISTGNEIAQPGTPLGPGQIYDINRFTLAAVVRAHGGDAVPYPAVSDTLSALDAILGTVAGDDLVVFSGGSSVGERDLMIDLLQRRGEVVFHGVAVKPGKPTVLGEVAGRPVLGMPGYPTSCLSNAYMLLVPVLRKMARLPAYEPLTVKAPLARRVVSTTGRHQFYTVRLSNGEAEPVFKASGDITSMSRADGYIEIPAQTDIVEKGESVEVKLF